MHAMRLIISGKVQGVGYRKWFAQQAIELELKGTVQNLESGDVEALIVGNLDSIEEILRRSQKGPRFAEVSHIQQTQLNAAECHFLDFKIIH